MGMESIKAKLIANSKKQNQWLQDANWRKENEKWLDVSFSIAVKILSALKTRKVTQKELAEYLDCSPQYVNKLLKGSENLQLETICKIESVLKIKLIEVPNNFNYSSYSFEEEAPRLLLDIAIKKDNVLPNTKSATIVNFSAVVKNYEESPESTYAEAI